MNTLPTSNQKDYQRDCSEDTKLQCTKCFKPSEEIPDCDLCNGNTTTAIEVFNLLNISNERSNDS